MVSSRLAPQITLLLISASPFSHLHAKHFGRRGAFSSGAARESFSWRQKTRRKIRMVIENVEKSNKTQNGTRGRQLLSLFAGLVLALTIGATKAKAQIVGDMVANVPFEFHAGNAEFPAGEYRIHS